MRSPHPDGGTARDIPQTPPLIHAHLLSHVSVDAHERSWYDRHREAIVKSGARHQAGDNYAPTTPKPDDEVNLYPYFNAGCFSGYHDGPGGFYFVYNTLFETLAEQERNAWREKVRAKECTEKEVRDLRDSRKKKNIYI